MSLVNFGNCLDWLMQVRKIYESSHRPMASPQYFIGVVSFSSSIYTLGYSDIFRIYACISQTMKENHGGRLLDPRLEDDRPQLLERGHDQNPDWRFKLDNQKPKITEHHYQTSILFKIWMVYYADVNGCWLQWWL